MIVVEGPAGIGKSTLVAAAARSAREDGTLVLRARCSPLEQQAAWGTARQLFDPLRVRGDWTELTAGAATLAERALAPELAEPALGGDAMHSAARGLVWLVSNLGERGSTMLVVDDVHWGDAPSLRWLALLAHSLEELPVGVLCAVRSGEPSTAPELLAELLAVAPEPPVRPRPLGPFATETLVRERFAAASAEFAHACHSATGGNPFLIGALLAQLAADGVAPDEAAAARLSAFGPEQVARWVERQLARLPDGAAALALAVAILGSGAPLRHAGALARLDHERASAAADALRAAGLLDDGGDLALAHPLIAGALYTKPSARRAQPVSRGGRAAARRRGRRSRAGRTAPPAHRARHASGHRRRPARGRRAGQRPRGAAERRRLSAARACRAARARGRSRRAPARARPGAGRAPAARRLRPAARGRGRRPPHPHSAARSRCAAPARSG